MERIINSQPSMKNSQQKKFRLYSAADLSGRRHELIGSRAKVDSNLMVQKQKELVEAAEQSHNDFVAWFNKIGTESDLTLPFRPKNLPITGQEVANPPIETEIHHFSTLEKLPPHLAASPSFWTSYQLEMVRLKLIDPADLATTNSNETGRARLQKAIRRSKTNLLDQCTRTILRQLGGLPEARGNVSVFVDCRMSRAWWRGYLSHQVASDMGLSVNDVWEHFRLTNATWDELQQFTVKRLTLVADRNVRSALVARLMESDIEYESPTKRRPRIQAFLTKIGARCAYQSLGALSPHHNLALFREMEV